MQDLVIEKIETLYPLVLNFLETEEEMEQPFSLFDGKPGAALFLYEYARFRPERKKECYEKINVLIEKAFDYISETADIKTSYCDGITGLLWLTQFFRNEGVIEMDADNIPEEVIEQLSEFSVSQTRDQDNCDLLHGGFGFWAFLLESKDLPDKEKRIGDQLQALDKIKIKTEFGYNWKVDLDIFQHELKERIRIDPFTSTHLGLAHGISSILILLAKTRLQGYFKRETEEAIHRGLAHLHSLKLDTPAPGYCYPMVVLNGKAESGGRLAWCNGDLCVAQAFWMGWKATNGNAYKTQALEIMHRAVLRNKKDAGVMDAGLCHGASGISQIFRRFYWETCDETFHQASNQWISETLAMAMYPDGLGGFKTYRSSAYGGSHAEHGFLSGISGIGTVLLSSLFNTPSTWDRVLQIA